MRAIGLHGTSVERAERILADGFQVSRNEYDWLGDGPYFFQDSPSRAWEWARERFGDRAAVIGAEIDLADCLDLLDSRWHAVVREAYDDILQSAQEEGYELPEQTSGAHRLDRLIINRTVKVLGRRGVQVRSVRTAFPEGEPLFPGSALWTKAHVQIAVRDKGALVRVWRAE